MDRISIHGSGYELGRALGERGREAFARIIRPSEGFRRLRRRLPDGWLDAAGARVRIRFPRVWSELEGLAAGLAQPLEDVLLWNCRGDIAPTGPEGCSSIAVQLPGGGRLAHNEDGDPALRDHCFLLEAAPDDGHAFASFCYPGSIPGHTLALNAAGFAYTVNNLRLTGCPVGVPRMVTARALLACDDVNGALALLRSTRRSGGFHFMMMDCTGHPPLSVEAPWQGVSCEVADPVAVHANHLVHDSFRDVPQVVTDSSRRRQQRLQKWRAGQRGLPAADTLLDALADRQDDPLPVFRTDPRDPDGENTLATALFELDADGLRGRVLAGPEGPVVLDRQLKPHPAIGVHEDERE